jgi:membrane-associated phospholipid phosphatase
MTSTSRNPVVGLVVLLGLAAARPASASGTGAAVSEVLTWNQIFIDTLIATNTPNSSSPRLGAIVHGAMFDAHTGIARRHEPIVVHTGGPRGASSPAAVVAAAYTAMAALFPSEAPSLADRYAASLAALRERCERRGHVRQESACGRNLERGIVWGIEVARAVLAWRANDGSGVAYPPFAGGGALGQWRPTPPAFSPMSAQGLAFTAPFVIASPTQFRPGPPRGLGSETYTSDFSAVRVLGRKDGSTRTTDQTALAPFWEGNASVHWNQAANQLARAHCLSRSASLRLLAVLNIAMADTAITIWSAKRFYGEVPDATTWRPVTAILLAETDGNPTTAPDPDWQPLVVTPSHPEYPAGHPALNGAAATVLLDHFEPGHTFTLTTTGQPPRTYDSIARARSEGNEARVWGGMHYPSTVAISDTAGEAIARHVDRHAMQPLRAGGGP